MFLSFYLTTLIIFNNEKFNECVGGCGIVKLEKFSGKTQFIATLFPWP
jgi:hypothetical protein